ncbi:carbon-nitrogen hydrolase family protein [Streptomyces sp. HNM0645]|uniref:carbon-nitrogen hydrolase family protein n=1 Tax=Streptomyces sp. HNM0645 TaxID=2782343 RepID=UPI0024B7544E|nr:carbon-nitrogen hydrolase family protein [Streptomyces sp. HNM0645]MDI9887525.1 carbon-nitrogen hydrolase family protein [Streptomyces sp. HNM0645]
MQAAPLPFDPVATLDVAERWLSEAAERNLDLVVFTEAFIGGYPKGSAFGGVVGDRTAAGRDEFARCWKGAVEVPGPVTDRLGQLAARARAHLVVGVVERDYGTLYCTVLFFSDTGTLLGKRRKLMPTGAERMIWGFGDGSTLDVHRTKLGRLGAVICWENPMPATRLAMYAQGIELYCAPTADSRESHHATMRHIAVEGRCFVLAANQWLRTKAFPPDHPTPYGDDPEHFVSRGDSSIGPLGEVLAGPVPDEEVLLTADLDMTRIPWARYDFDAVGHYARPDIFRLYVDTTNRRAVQTGDTASVCLSNNLPSESTSWRARAS